MPNTASDTQQTPDPTFSPRGRGPVVLLMAWSAVEGTVLAFALRATVSELISDLTGFTVNSIVLMVLLSVFVTIIVAGSYACVQQLKDAVTAKQFGNVVSMGMVQIVVLLFEVIFFSPPLTGALNAWLTPQGIALGQVGAYGLTICALFAGRGMAWYLFGRSGAPALLALLNRKS